MIVKSRPNALVFRDAALAVPKIVESLFNDTPERPKIQATNINGRETIKKIYKERGDGTQNLLPVIGCKMTQMGILRDSGANQFALKNGGASLGQAEDNKTYRFHGKQVLMEFQSTLFTNNYDDILQVAADCMMMKTEMSFELRVDPGIIFPTRVSISEDAISIPDISMEGEITKFEFELPGMQVSSFVGNVVTSANAEKIVIGGGPVHIDINGRLVVADRTSLNVQVE